jgi:hypothetical protein
MRGSDLMPPWLLHVANGIVMSGFLVLSLLMTPGCESMKSIGFGLDVANADTTLSFRHNDGKSVVAAEQGANRINFNLRR